MLRIDQLAPLLGQDGVDISKPLHLVKPPASKRKWPGGISAPKHSPSGDKVGPLWADLGSWASEKVEML